MDKRDNISTLNQQYTKYSLIRKKNQYTHVNYHKILSLFDQGPRMGTRELEMILSYKARYYWLHYFSAQFIVQNNSAPFWTRIISSFFVFSKWIPDVRGKQTWQRKTFLGPDLRQNKNPLVDLVLEEKKFQQYFCQYYVVKQYYYVIVFYQVLYCT